jgi:hypothetical protein
MKSSLRDHKICGRWLTVQVADDDCTSICCTPLPLREVECADLQQDVENRLKLVGGSSVRQVDWITKRARRSPSSAAGCWHLRSFQTAWSRIRRSK